MITVYTVIGGGFDNLRPPVIENVPGVRYICFTDNPVAPTVRPWEFRPLHPAGAGCRTARVPKILPHLMLPDDTEYSIYHDGNFQLAGHPTRIVESMLQDADWSAHRHPCRTCIYQEAEILLREGIGTRELIEAEIGRYRGAGFGPDRGLWANGFLVRRHTPEVAALNETWWGLYSAGCERDQLSFPVARERAGVRIRTINEQIYDSPVINFQFHAAWKDKGTNPEFHAERAAIRARLAKLHQMTGTVSNYPEY